LFVPDAFWFPFRACATNLKEVAANRKPNPSESDPAMFARLRPVCVALAALIPITWLLAADEPVYKLQKGDRIAFLGDSITQAGAGPKGYISLIKSTLNKKHKDFDLEFIGAGISGNKVPDLQKRVEKDVIAKKPTLVFIYIGINDVWHGLNDPSKGTPPDKFETGLREVIGKIKDSGAKVVLCTPSVIGEKMDGSNKGDAKLDEYANLSRTVAKDMQVAVCDLRKEFIAYEKEHNKENKEKGVLTSDGVHLNEAGNKFVAEKMMKMLGN
jgi:isoamyl acetate esterase